MNKILKALKNKKTIAYSNPSINPAGMVCRNMVCFIKWNTDGWYEICDKNGEIQSTTSDPVLALMVATFEFRLYPEPVSWDIGE